MTRIIVLAFALVLASCATLDPLVAYPGKYEGNRVFLGNGLECRVPYQFADGKPTNCRLPKDWPDRSITDVR